MDRQGVIAADKFVPEVPTSVRADGDTSVLFTSNFKRFKVWMRPRHQEMRNGAMITTDQGHVIEFKDGYYLADNTRKIGNPMAGDQTEVEFLRDMVRERETIGTAHPVYEGNPFIAVPVEEGQGGSDTFQIFDAHDTHELRALFSQEEITEHKLERAAKDTLIATAMRLEKAVPDPWLEERVVTGAL